MTYDERRILKELADPKTQRTAFSVLVSRYSEPLYWKLRRIVLEHEDTNDILQNTFIKAWNYIEDFQNRSKISTWLYRIAINEALSPA